MNFQLLASVHTYYVCYNQVTYLVACEHALRSGNPSATTVLAATGRVVRQPKYERVRHRRLSRTQLLLASFRCFASRAVTVYVPHLRGGRLVQVLARLASSTHLIDDGLDTLRERPRNLNPQCVAPFGHVLTFSDYRRTGIWTRSLIVTPVCPLEVLLQDVRPTLPSGTFQALVVQSPGVELRQAPALTESAPHDVLVLAHGNPHKRGEAPPGLALVSARGWSIEKTIASFEGKVLVGESMVAVAALLLARRGTLIVSLTREQYANLRCLHEVLASADVRLVLQ